MHGHELEFIFRSLVELKLQLEELRRRIEEAPQRVEVIDMTQPREYAEVVSGTAVDESGMAPQASLASGKREAASGVEDLAVVYRPGMRMTEVERAAIEAALKETRGNRRRAADRLGIGERTLYRKIKEYGLG
jgi:DNA-binding NtrC family response regulator